MQKGNILDIAVKAVRDSCKTNMYQSNSVQYYSFYMGFFEYVNWYEEAHSDSYMTHLMAIDFDQTPSVDARYLLGLESETEARLELESLFQEEIKAFRAQLPFSSIKKLPFTIQEWLDTKKPLLSFVQETQEDHAMNYFLHLPGGDELFWFADGIYNHKSPRGNKPLVSAEWQRYTHLYERLSKGNQKKFDELDKQFRLRKLFL